MKRSFKWALLYLGVFLLPLWFQLVREFAPDFHDWGSVYGALIGSLFAGLIAYLSIQKTSTDAKELAEDAKESATIELQQAKEIAERQIEHETEPVNDNETIGLRDY